MLLAVVPITAGFPHDRLLFFVGIGGMALLAMLLVRLFDRRRLDSKPAPRSILMLAPGTTSLTLERSSEHALSIEAKDGWLGSPFDNVYRDSTERFPNNYRVRLSDVEIRVVASTEDGRPKRVLFTFERQLEDDSLRWVRYEDGKYVPFEPPGVGQTAVIEAVPFSLLAAVWRPPLKATKLT
ncbi:MAG: hypothetical protein ACRD1X_17200 [Vicinamibacteria bacterium]